MQYVRLGSSGLKVSELCLGTMSMGSSAWKAWVLDEERSLPILRRALELGISFFDMADWYSRGRNEEVVGRNLLRMAARDNLVLAAGKLGLGVADVPTPIAFFADLRTDDEGRFVWHGGPAAPGRLVELRAEMNLLVAASNCPHPFDPRPDYAPGPIEATVWRSPPPAADDPARHNGEEAERGFINTDREFGA